MQETHNRNSSYDNQQEMSVNDKEHPSEGSQPQNLQTEHYSEKK